MKKKLFVISDVHGHYNEMIQALAQAGYDENDDNHLLISVGDAFDRGTQSRAIYKYFKRLSDENKAIILMGNHDLMFIEHLDGTSLSPFNYIRNGENETFADFMHQTKPFETWCILKDIKEPTFGDFAKWLEIARSEIKKEYPGLLEWLKNRPYYYETKNYIFTHGAIDTYSKDWHEGKGYRVGLSYYGWKALIWDDGSFFRKKINNTNKTVVIGHFGTNHLRDIYHLKKDKKNDYSILKRKDGRIIAIDGTVVLSKKVNVLVVEDELI